MYQDIEYSLENGIALITLNRPKVLNAIRIQTYKDIIAALNTCEQDDDVKVVVMTGAGGKFTAGNDLRDLLPEGDQAGVSEGVANIFAALTALSKPLILAQEGVAVGIGANLLLHADLAYAGNSIRYSLPFAKIGVASEGGSSVLLKEAIGAKNAADLLLTGRFFSAEEAEKWGLINAAVEDGSALEHAMKAANSLLKNSEGSMRAIKQLGKSEGHSERVAKMVKAEMDEFYDLLQTEDTQARINRVLSGGK